jgi:endoglucanase
VPRTRRVILWALITPLVLLSGSVAAAASTVWTVSPGAGAVQSAVGTPAGTEALLWSVGSASTSVPDGGQLVLHARADLCNGPPQAVISVDGAVLGRVDVVNASEWWSYPVGPVLAAGAHSVAIGFPNDAVGPGCDRNLHVGWVDTTAPTSTSTTTSPTGTTAPAPTGAKTTNPFAAGRPYVDPRYPSVAAATARRAGDPSGAAALDRISAQTAAFWAGDWYSRDQVGAAVGGYARRANSAGQTGVVVVYAIPGRDCGSYSAGGLTPDTYPGWVSAVADGLRGTRTAVVLEPDALAELGACSGQGDRSGLLRAAVTTLNSAGATVYLDAGHSGWVDAATMASRLRAAGVAGARGFATNVSAFQTSADERAYAEQVSAGTGGARYVIDTSRNGAGATSQWCNPAGRKLGAVPGIVTDGSHQDANLWVKRVGESDGSCGGGPPAGQWWTDYAMSLAR